MLFDTMTENNWIEVTWQDLDEISDTYNLQDDDRDLMNRFYKIAEDSVVSSVRRSGLRDYRIYTTSRLTYDDCRKLFAEYGFPNPFFVGHKKSVPFFSFSLSKNQGRGIEYNAWFINP